MIAVRSVPGQPDFRISVSRGDGEGVVAAAGDLDLASAEAFRATLREQLAEGPVRLDLSELAFMDSSGVRVLDAVLRDVDREGWALTIGAALGDNVRQVLEMTRDDRPAPAPRPGRRCRPVSALDPQQRGRAGRPGRAGRWCSRTASAATRTCGASSRRPSRTTTASCSSTTSAPAGRTSSAYDRRAVRSLRRATPTTSLEICRELELQRRRLRRPLGERDDRRARGRTRRRSAFGALVLVGPSPRYIDDGDYVGGFSARGHRRAARVAGQQLPRLVERDGAGDHGQPRPARARRGADQQLLPHRPGDRAPASPASRSSPTTAPTCRRSRVPTLVLQCRDDVIAPDGGRRVRARAASRAASSCSSTATGPLPEPERAARRRSPRSGRSSDGGDRRRRALGRCSRSDRGPLRERAVRLPLDARPTARSCKVNRDVRCAGPGYARDELVGGRRFQDLLTAGRPDLPRDALRAAAADAGRGARDRRWTVVRADGARLPVLVNSVLRRDATGAPQLVRTTVFDATDRRRYERELLRARRGASTRSPQRLQRSLLVRRAAERPPSLERRASPTSPAVRGLEVGGDWYDAFWLDGGGRVALVVGDVVGRGIEAAATMGQLRSAVRALAATGLGPGPLLDGSRRLRRAATASGRWRRSSTPRSTSATAGCATPAPATPRRGPGRPAARAACCGTGARRRSTRSSAGRRAPRRARRCAPARRCCSTPTASSSGAGSHCRTASTGCWPR